MFLALRLMIEKFIANNYKNCQITWAVPKNGDNLSSEEATVYLLPTCCCLFDPSLDVENDVYSTPKK